MLHPRGPLCEMLVQQASEEARNRRTAEGGTESPGGVVPYLLSLGIYDPRQVHG